MLKSNRMFKRSTFAPSHGFLWFSFRKSLSVFVVFFLYYWRKMETIAISESTSLIVIKKSPQTFFSFTYGDAKVCFICGRCKLDGYTMGRGETVPISCGFGSYQVTVYIDEYANFSSNESLHQVLAEAQVPEAACDKITDYLKNDRGRREFLEQCIIVKLDKWKWPLLASLKRLIKPERFNTNCWFDVTFENIKSPIIQWSQVISDIVENIKECKHYGIYYFQFNHSVYRFSNSHPKFK